MNNVHTGTNIYYIKIKRENMKQSPRNILMLVICGALFFLILSLAAHAEPNSSNQWEFQLAPYA
jgi:hypothetical protein